jgi:ABC-type transporter Mla MlaB component
VIDFFDLEMRLKGHVQFENVLVDYEAGLNFIKHCPSKVITVSCGELACFDNALLALLLSFHRCAQNLNKKVVVVDLCQDALKLVQLTGLDTIINI